MTADGSIVCSEGDIALLDIDGDVEGHIQAGGNISKLLISSGDLLDFVSAPSGKITEINVEGAIGSIGALVGIVAMSGVTSIEADQIHADVDANAGAGSGGVQRIVTNGVASSGDITGSVVADDIFASGFPGSLGTAQVAGRSPPTTTITSRPSAPARTCSSATTSTPPATCPSPPTPTSSTASPDPRRAARRAREHASADSPLRHRLRPANVRRCRMIRPRPNELTARRALVGAALLLLLIPLLPPRFTRWAAGFGQVTRLLIAPVSHPIDAVAGWLSVRAGDPPEPELVRQLESERDRFELLYRQEIARSQRLQRLVEDLQEGIKLGEDPSMRLVTATVIGRSSDLASQLLEVRAGASKGVARNTTATVHGSQLLGQVVRTGPLTSWVQPITAPGARPLQGRVILDDPNRILRCNLAPTGDGALAGRLSFLLDDQTQEPVIPQIGATVRLDDDLWPANAQMLLVGAVERVAPYENEPSRWEVVVRPRLALDQIRGEVTLRVTTDPAGAHRAGASADGTSAAAGVEEGGG